MFSFVPRAVGQRVAKETSLTAPPAPTAALKADNQPYPEYLEELFVGIELVFSDYNTTVNKEWMQWLNDHATVDEFDIEWTLAKSQEQVHPIRDGTSQMFFRKMHKTKPATYP
jgi:hypothetical protein